MPKQFIINKIIHKKLTSNNNWNLILVTIDNYKLFGFNYFEPMIDHIIICNNLIQRDNNSVSGDDDENTQGGKFVQLSEYEHPYPATKVMWAPSKNNSGS